MVSAILQIILIIILIPIILSLQLINFIITIIQFPFIWKKYKNIQELFEENSKYIFYVFKVKIKG